MCDPRVVSVSLSDYRAAVSEPGAVAPVLASALARLPIAMFSLATLLYVQRESGSFAVAGAVSASSLIGVSLGSVVQGRVMDRRGPSQVLLLVAALFALAAAGLVVSIESGAPLLALIPLAVLAGFTQPAMPGASRALWAELVPAGPRREAAYSYEAISLEVFFILGPALAAFLVTAPWSGTGLVVASSAMVVGSVAFALCRPVRATRPAPRAASGGGLSGVVGVIADPGMLTVAIASLGFGLVIGSVEVGVPAVASALGSPSLGGVLLSAWSVTSVLVGLLYGMRPWPRPLYLRIPVLMAAFGVLAVLMSVAGASGSLVLLVLTMLLAGGLITPQVTGHSLGVELVAPGGSATEAFGWVVTAATLGIALGQSVAGVAVEASGPAAAFVAGGLGGLVVATVLWFRRRTVRMPDPAPVVAAV